MEIEGNLRFYLNDGSGEYLNLCRHFEDGGAYSLNLYNKEGKWVGHYDVAEEDNNGRYINPNKHDSSEFKNKEELIEEIIRAAKEFFDVSIKAEEIVDYVRF